MTATSTRKIRTQPNGLSLYLLYGPDQLLPMPLDLLLLKIVYVIDDLHEVPYIPSSGLNAHTICPTDLQMADGVPIPLTDIEELIENIIVVLSV